MIHRDQAYSTLSGSGIVIGAFMEAATLPPFCEVSYFDVLSKEEATKFFPEIDSNQLVNVDIIGNLDKRDLRKLGQASQDFVIANHVIEHLANPIAFVEDLLFVSKIGGRICLSAPDKEFTFDRTRPLTTFEHLRDEYQEGIEEVSDDHYLEFLRHAGPHVFEEPGRNIDHDIAHCRNRREHAHVWNSDSFLGFLEDCRQLLPQDFSIIKTSKGNETKVECFVLMERAS